MKHSPITAAALAALLAAAPLHAEDAPAPDAAPAAAEKGLPEGASRCVSLHAIRSTRVIDAQTILFEMAGGKTLANRLPRKCPGLAFEKRFAYRTSLSQLCNTDVISVITNVGRGASCGLGYFEPWVAPEQVGATPGEGTLKPVDKP